MAEEKKVEEKVEKKEEIKPEEKKTDKAVKSEEQKLEELAEAQAKEKPAEEKKEKKKKEVKVELEREYIIPLRRKLVNIPRYRRAPRAIKEIRKFIARHMKVYDRDLNKVKLDRYLNEEMWFRGIQKPYAKIKVKAKKLSTGEVIVELAELPEKVRWKKAREEKAKEKVEKKKKPKAEEGEKKKEEEKPGKEEKEKEAAVKEAGRIMAEEQHKEIKHETQISKQPKHLFRKALNK